MSATEEVRIRAIAAGGNGVGTLADGRTVFVPRTAPGDLVTLRAVRLRRRHAEARLGELREGGPGRVTPPCPHYLGDDCGGCQVQHLDAATQRTVRQRIVGDALRRIGKLDVADPPIVPSEKELEYRSKITLTYRPGRLGYHRLGAAGEVFALERCHIAEPAVHELYLAVREGIPLLPPDTEQVVLRLDADGGRHVIVRTPGGRAWGQGAEFGAVLGVPATVWWHPADGAPRAVSGAATPWPATVFEQVHPAMGHVVRRAAVEAIGRPAHSGEIAWDLYAGIGETTAMLAEAGYQVESVEIDPRAVQLARERAGVEARREAGDVAHVVPRLSSPGVVVVNPPRAGLDERVVVALGAAVPRRIAYVSCDPATLARDLARMAGSYRLTSVTAFDQFPQTAHVETLAVLERPVAS